MPTPKKGARLGGGPAHERLMLSNLVTALFEHDQITTTEAKAKRMRPLAERMVTFAKRGDLAARRRVLATVRDKSVVHRLFTEIAPDMAERQGGYTRITKTMPRKGDNAPMAIIELVREPVAKKAVVKEASAATKRAAKDAEAPAKVEETEEPKVEATEVPVEAPENPEPADIEPKDEPKAEAAEATAPAGLVAADGGFGEGSAAPLENGEAPEGFTVKGNMDSMKYHVAGSRWYDATIAEVWFKDAASAEKAGFAPAGGEKAQEEK